MNLPSGYSSEHDDVPTELREIAALANRLGANERAGAPARMEDRLFQTTREILSPSPASIPISRDQRRASSSRLWRIAAVVGLAGALGLSLVGWRVMSLGGSTGTSAGTVGGRVDAAALQAELDRLFAATTAWEGGSSTELSALHGEIDAFANAADPWSGADSGMEEVVNEDSL